MSFFNNNDNINDVNNGNNDNNNTSITFFNNDNHTNNNNTHMDDVASTQQFFDFNIKPHQQPSSSLGGDASFTYFVPLIHQHSGQPNGYYQGGDTTTTTTTTTTTNNNNNALSNNTFNNNTFNNNSLSNNTFNNNLLNNNTFDNNLLNNNSSNNNNNPSKRDYKLLCTPSMEVYNTNSIQDTRPNDSNKVMTSSLQSNELVQLGNSLTAISLQENPYPIYQNYLFADNGEGDKDDDDDDDLDLDGDNNPAETNSSCQPQPQIDPTMPTDRLLVKQPMRIMINKEKEERQEENDQPQPQAHPTQQYVEYFLDNANKNDDNNNNMNNEGAWYPDQDQQDQRPLHNNNYQYIDENNNNSQPKRQYKKKTQTSPSVATTKAATTTPIIPMAVTQIETKSTKLSKSTTKSGKPTSSPTLSTSVSSQSQILSSSSTYSNLQTIPPQLSLSTEQMFHDIAQYSTRPWYEFILYNNEEYPIHVVLYRFVVAFRKIQFLLFDKHPNILTPPQHNHGGNSGNNTSSPVEGNAKEDAHFSRVVTPQLAFAPTDTINPITKKYELKAPHDDRYDSVFKYIESRQFELINTGLENLILSDNNNSNANIENFFQFVSQHHTRPYFAKVDSDSDYSDSTEFQYFIDNSEYDIAVSLDQVIAQLGRSALKYLVCEFLTFYFLLVLTPPNSESLITMSKVPKYFPHDTSGITPFYPFEYVSIHDVPRKQQLSQLFNNVMNNFVVDTSEYQKDQPTLLNFINKHRSDHKKNNDDDDGNNNNNKSGTQDNGLRPQYYIPLQRLFPHPIVFMFNNNKNNNSNNDNIFRVEHPCQIITLDDSCRPEPMERLSYTNPHYLSLSDLRQGPSQIVELVRKKTIKSTDNQIFRQFFDAERALVNNNNTTITNNDRDRMFWSQQRLFNPGQRIPNVSQAAPNVMKKSHMMLDSPSLLKLWLYSHNYFCNIGVVPHDIRFEL